MKYFWTEEELSLHWTLSYEEIELLKSKPVRNHIALAIQLKYYKYFGKFPESGNEISELPLKYIADQLEINISTYYKFDWTKRVVWYHRNGILKFLNIKKFEEVDDSSFFEYLKEVIKTVHEVKEVVEMCCEWLYTHKIEPPSTKRLEREVNSAYNNFEKALYENLSKSIPFDSKYLVDYCLEDNEETISFSSLKSDPGRISLDSVLKELGKLEFINQLELPTQLLNSLSPKIINRIRLRVLSERAWEIRRHPMHTRYALMCVFFYTRRSEIIDGLVELLIQVIHRLSTKAERKVVKTLMKDFRKVYGKNTLLMRIAEAALYNPNSTVKDIVYPIADVQVLRNLVKESKTTGKGYQQEVHSIIRSSYSNHYRRMVPQILKSMEFCSNNTLHQPVIDGLRWLATHQNSKQQFYYLSEEIPIEGVIRPKFFETTIESDDDGEKRVNRINYEICVLQALREKLRCKEIWVQGADKYRNPDEDLPQDFSVNRAYYYEDLGITQDATEFIENLREKMHTSLSSLNETILNNHLVKIPARRNHISLTPLAEQLEPQNINRLKGQVQNIWPMTSLLDILKEADLRIGFTDCFKTQRTSERLNRGELQKRLLLALYGLGTNTGLKRISASRHGVSHKELLHVRQYFIHKNALRQAIANVVNAIFAIRNPALWGEGTTACASDSKKFGSWDQNLMTEWHIRYGGRGVMIYWHVEKKSTCIYSQLKRCSSSEVASMIEGVLRHCTEMSVEKQYVDTHGQSEVAFAFSHLLGFNLMPRLKNISKQKLYVPDTGTLDNYQNIAPILTRPINWEIISQQYDQMVQYTTALKQGTAEPEAILRRFTRGNITHPTYKALSELGKVIKTIFLCDYLENEELRREIHEGLNVVENWNSANSFIFFGKGGEVSTNRLEDQELSVLSLHLVQICLVYVNTLMIQQVVSGEEWKDKLVEEDYRALSPLIYSHVNPYGVFELNMDKRLQLIT